MLCHQFVFLLDIGVCHRPPAGFQIIPQFIVAYLLDSVVGGSTQMEHMDCKSPLLHPLCAEPERLIRLKERQDDCRSAGDHQDKNQCRMNRPQRRCRTEKDNKLVQGGKQSLYACRHFLTGMRVCKFHFFQEIIPVFQIGVMDKAQIPQKLLFHIHPHFVPVIDFHIVRQKIHQKLQQKNGSQPQ